MKEIEHNIDLVLGALIFNKLVYRCNPIETKELKKQVNELIVEGFMRESISPCLVLTLFVPKKDETYRMCVDRRVINNITIKYRYLIRRLDDMLNKLYGATTFPKLI